MHTGPEVWAQTGGNIDGFACATGTGGTLAGVSTFIKEVRYRIIKGWTRSMSKSPVCTHFFSASR